MFKSNLFNLIPADQGSASEQDITNQRYLMFYMALFLIVTIMVGINALEEVNTRESYLAYLDKEIDKDLKELNQLRADKIEALNTSKELDTTTNTRKIPELALSERIFDIDKNLKTYNERLQASETAKERVLALMLQGSWRMEDTIFGIMSATPLYVLQQSTETRSTSLGLTSVSGIVPSRETSTLMQLREEAIFVFIRNSPSGVLIGFLMITAAGLGACIYTIREKQWKYLGRNIFSGLGAGIAGYLGVQGDALQYISAIQSTAFSPATKVFIGFISGLYAHEVYRLMTYLVVSFVNKFAPESDIPLPDAPTPTTNATTANTPPPGNDTTKNATQEIAPGDDPNPPDTANGHTVANKDPAPQP